MAHVLEPIEDSFLHTAPLIIRSTVALPNSPEQVWEALGSDEMWSWFPAIDNLKWITPPGEAGCVRELRIGRFITVEEEFYRWEPNVRSTFRVTKASHKAIKALAEDFLLDERADGGTTLTWTMAVRPAGPKPPAFLAGLLKPGNKHAIGGIKKILPPA